MIKMKPEDMIIADLMIGDTVEGQYKPSSDTATNLEIYRAFSSIGGINHTRSINTWQDLIFRHSAPRMQITAMVRLRVQES